MKTTQRQMYNVILLLFVFFYTTGFELQAQIQQEDHLQAFKTLNLTTHPAFKSIASCLDINRFKEVEDAKEKEALKTGLKPKVNQVLSSLNTEKIEEKYFEEMFSGYIGKSDENIYLIILYGSKVGGMLYFDQNSNLVLATLSYNNEEITKIFGEGINYEDILRKNVKDVTSQELSVVIDVASNSKILVVTSTDSNYNGFNNYIDSNGNYLGSCAVELGCFPSDGKVMLSDYSTISIAEINEGISILSLDENLNLRSSKVEALEVHEYSNQMLEINLENEHSVFASNGISVQAEKTMLSVTPNHPILTEQGIMPAGALKNNDFVRVYNNLLGTLDIYIVRSINTKRVNEKVYNIKTASKFYLVDGVVVSVK